MLTKLRYTTVAITLHWLIAVLMIFQIGLGLRMEEAGGRARFTVFQLHKSVGITILLLVLLRLIWRFYRKPPPLAAHGWERALAVSVHALFYLLLLALPISGWIIVSSSEIVVPTLLYGAVPWPHLSGLSEAAPASKASWNAAAEFVHVNIVYIFYMAFALHVAGALKHHFIDRDSSIGRMLPGTRAGSWHDPRLIAVAACGLFSIALGLTWAMPDARVTMPQPTSPSLAPDAGGGLLPTAVQRGEAPSAPNPEVIEASDEPPAKVDAVSPSEQAVPLWAIGSGSSIRFRTAWSGEPVDGGFSRFDGDIAFDPERLDRSHVTIRITTASLYTGDLQRDETLKDDQWFSVAQHAVATFRADRFRKLGANRFIGDGSLTLKGVTAPVALSFTLTIVGQRAMMRGSATIDRLHYRIGEGEYSSTADIPAAVSIDVAVQATRRADRPGS